VVGGIILLHLDDYWFLKKDYVPLCYLITIQNYILKTQRQKHGGQKEWNSLTKINPKFINENTLVFNTAGASNGSMRELVLVSQKICFSGV
jgi:hypothetical protein